MKSKSSLGAALPVPPSAGWLHSSGSQGGRYSPARAPHATYSHNRDRCSTVVADRSTVAATAAALLQPLLQSTAALLWPTAALLWPTAALLQPLLQSTAALLWPTAALVSLTAAPLQLSSQPIPTQPWAEQALLVICFPGLRDSSCETLQLLLLSRSAAPRTCRYRRDVSSCCNPQCRVP